MDLLTFLFPRTCAHCGQALHGSANIRQWHYLCDACALQLRRVEAKSCQRCAVPVYGSMTDKPICSVCHVSPPAWDEVRCLLRYTGPARAWVRDYKYNDACWVEREWKKLLSSPDFRFLHGWLTDAILIPVPLHPVRRLMRGFNQSEEFSKILLKTLEPPRTEINTKILKRVRWTRQQARLRKKDRKRNVEGAFEVDKKINLGSFALRRIILVDDLLTTGFTLTVCVDALRQAGFKRVDVLTLARG